MPNIAAAFNMRQNKYDITPYSFGSGIGPAHSL